MKRNKSRSYLSATGLLLGLAASALVAPPSEAAPTNVWVPPAASYGVFDEHDVAITMSDGVTLKANVYSPADWATGQPAPGPFPVVVTTTPYGKDAGDTDPALGALGMGRDDALITRGYIHLVVDVRGTGESGGSWSFAQPRESVDGAEIVDWAAHMPRSTGNVGLIGQSYGAINQLLTAGRIGKDSALKAILPIVPSDDLYRDVFTSGGVPNPLVASLYVAGNGPSSVFRGLQSGLEGLSGPTGLSDLVNLTLGHLSGLNVLPASDLVLGGPAANDSQFWAERRPHDVLPGIVENHIPTMVIGGWRDAFQRGGPMIYSGLQNAAAGRPVGAPMLPNQKASPDYQLIEGPWWHATVGEVGSKPFLDVNAVALRWFEQWLKGVDTGVTKTANPLHSYDLTADRWVKSATYPYAGATPTRFYPAPAGTLTTAAPSIPGADDITWSGAPQCTPSVSQYVLIGNDVQALAEQGSPPPACDLDDRPAQTRPTAATYTTAPFATSQVIAGPIAAHIVASVTSTDSEWVVRVEDVAPDGSSLPLSRGALLGSHRMLDQTKTWRASDGTILRPYHPSTQSSLLGTIPGLQQEYDVEVPGITATIAAGHSIRVTIGTTDSPALIPTVGQSLALLGGVYSITRGGTSPSYVQIPLASASSLGETCTDPIACP